MQGQRQATLALCLARYANVIGNGNELAAYLRMPTAEFRIENRRKSDSKAPPVIPNGSTDHKVVAMIVNEEGGLLDSNV